MVGMDAAETTDDGRAKARANWTGRAVRVAAILFALCVPYVLSVGPVIGALRWARIDQFDPAVAGVFVFYAPVIYLHDHTPLQGPLDQYVDCCERVVDRLR
jgi:hypothetical protein